MRSMSVSRRGTTRDVGRRRVGVLAVAVLGLAALLVPAGSAAGEPSGQAVTTASSSDSSAAAAGAALLESDITRVLRSLPGAVRTGPYEVSWDGGSVVSTWVPGGPTALGSPGAAMHLPGGGERPRRANSREQLCRVPRRHQRALVLLLREREIRRADAAVPRLSVDAVPRLLRVRERDDVVGEQPVRRHHHGLRRQHLGHGAVARVRALAQLQRRLVGQRPRRHLHLPHVRWSSFIAGRAPGRPGC